MNTKTTKKCAARRTVEKPSIVKTKCTAKKCRVRAAKKAVTFTVHAERGKAVYLAGDFNAWNPTAKKMAYKARQGIYTATVKLSEGEHEYKFVMDGAWCADPENVNSVSNDQGTFNSIIVVK